MSQATKAALLSSFVLPGAGHFFLKKKISGFVFSSIAVVTLYGLVSGILSAATDIAEKIKSGDIDMSDTSVTELALSMTAGAESHSMGLVGTIFTVVWIVSIIDSYRIGYLIDSKGLNEDA